MVKEFNENVSYQEEVKEGITVIDFYADWCGPCKMLAPAIEKLAEDNTDIKVIKLDADKYKDLASEQGVMSIPTVLFYKDGEVVSRQVGFRPSDALQEIVDSLK